MAILKAASGGALLAATVLGSGCTSICSATPEKLASLQRGMSKAEATRVMGCRGTPVAPADAADNVSSLEWRGPDPGVVVTQLDFVNDQLLYYVVAAKGGL